MRRTAKIILAAALVAVPAACAETRYQAYDANPAAGSPFDRTVEFQLTRAFFEDPPACATVLSFAAASGSGDGGAGEGALVEDAVSRHLSLKLARVIGPHSRDRLARDMAVDLVDPRHRAAFARNARCDAFVTVRPWGGEGMFAVFWTQARIGIEIEMTRARDGRLLWKARHSATRSEGGLPLSPFAAAFSLFEVGRFETDGDMPASIIEDAVRRVATTLPDARLAHPTPVAGRGATNGVFSLDADGIQWHPVGARPGAAGPAFKQGDVKP
jgi:hypothetical protein